MIVLWKGSLEKRSQRNLKLKHLLIAAAIVVLIPLVWAAWWFLSPLVIDDVVDEDFPMSYNAELPTGMSQEEAEDQMVEAAAVDAPVDEEMPEPMASPTAPVQVKVGSFTDADRFHKGSGSATIYRGADGALLLRFEDFNVTNGPALHVILSPHPNARNSEEVHLKGYVDLGDLKGNVGNQNYPLPSDLDVSTIGSVIIYCEPFSVVFSVAPLRDAG